MARYYCSTTADFLMENSHLGKFTDPLTLYRYNYVKSSPSNYEDPSDHDNSKYFSYDDFLRYYFSEMYKSTNKAWENWWNDMFHNYDRVIDIELEVGFEVGADITVQHDGIKVSGQAELVHKKVFSEHGFKEELEEIKVSFDLAEIVSASLGSQATADSNWNCGSVEFVVTVADNEIIGVMTTNEATTLEIKDQTIELGFAGYVGIGGGGKIVINLSELGRILGLLPEKQEYTVCY